MDFLTSGPAAWTTLHARRTSKVGRARWSIPRSARHPSLRCGRRTVWMTGAGWGWWAASSRGSRNSESVPDDRGGGPRRPDERRLRLVGTARRFHRPPRALDRCRPARRWRPASALCEWRPQRRCQTRRAWRNCARAVFRRS